MCKPLSQFMSGVPHETAFLPALGLSTGFTFMLQGPQTTEGGGCSVQISCLQLDMKLVFTITSGEPGSTLWQRPPGCVGAELAAWHSPHPQHARLRLPVTLARN